VITLFAYFWNSVFNETMLMVMIVFLWIGRVQTQNMTQ
jgi:hypothetical protein